MSKHQLRLLLCSTASVALIAGALSAAWFQIDLSATHIAIDLRSARMCAHDGVCTSVDLGRIGGAYSTIASIAFWCGLALAALVLVQTVAKVLANWASVIAGRIGYALGSATFLCAFAGGYLFGPETDSVTDMMGIIVARTFAPVMLLGGSLLGMIAVRYALHEDRSDDVGEYKPIVLDKDREHPSYDSQSGERRMRAATDSGVRTKTPSDPGTRTRTPSQQMERIALPGDRKKTPSEPGTRVKAPSEPGTRVKAPSEPGTRVRVPTEPGMRTRTPSQQVERIALPGDRAKNPSEPGTRTKAPSVQPAVARTSSSQQPAIARTSSSQQPAIARTESSQPVVARTSSSQQPAVARTSSQDGAALAARARTSSSGPIDLAARLSGAPIAVSIKPPPPEPVPVPPDQIPVAPESGLVIRKRTPSAGPISPLQIPVQPEPGLMTHAKGSSPPIPPAEIAHGSIDPEVGHPAIARAFTPPDKPAALRGKLRYAVNLASLTSMGITAYREDGTTKHVGWDDVVGIIARRLPAEPPYESVTFVDLVSMAGSTLRILPWTRVDGAPVLGHGEERARAFVQLIAARCLDAKLDSWTKVFADGAGQAVQLPSTRTLAAHDDKLA